ncbi:hypothetical protein MMC07_000140 [Pseudocyphellaria aurata]|nr:hypothetical protein [Pseudocyphellaria aurata]
MLCAFQSNVHSLSLFRGERVKTNATGCRKQLLRNPNPLQLAAHLGIAYQCIAVNPADQCLGLTPGLASSLSYRKNKRFYAGGVEVPEEENPDCTLIVGGGNVNSDSLAEKSSNGHQPVSSGMATDDDGEDDKPDAIFAIIDD